MKTVKEFLGFNSSRIRLLDANRDFAKSVPAGSLVLDAGAGSSPYKHLFEHASYESADFEQVEKDYAPSTYVCDLKSIPVKEERFDFVIFNQVLEHVPEPKLVLEELNRVLKPGGKMIYSGPLFYEEHEQPYDFYRYTQYGLQYLFSNSGFSVEQLNWLEGYFGTVGYQLNRMARYIPLNPKDFGNLFLGIFLLPIMLFIKIAFAILSVLFHRLEMISKFEKKGYPKNYVLIVEKKS